MGIFHDMKEFSMADTIASKFSKSWLNTPLADLCLFEWFNWAMDVPLTTVAVSNHGKKNLTLPLFNMIIHAWTSPGRVYHSLGGHLIPLLQRILKADVGEDLSSCSELQAKALIMAAFYHDACYAATVPDTANVEASADLWDEHAQALGIFGTTFAVRVREEILSTDYATTRESVDYAQCLLRRFDLASLASPWSDYTRNSAMIEDEQRQLRGDSFDPGAHKQGTILFLAQMLSKARIFPKDRTSSAVAPGPWDRMEWHARDNMGRHLSHLLLER